MRVIAELPHPDCKITLFSMNQKYIIKLEKGTFEQIYKISELDIPKGVNGVFQLLDSDFIKSAAERFNQMRIDFSQAYKRYDENNI
ncbi:hypothetical protein [Daejeonella sp.]|uniref:hypothetical protein n=1 Tax=Daejeonella sp. TaxID=2805397 RepID=UPI002719C0BC|nr:hypothetical protein [Daejeonella sp.]MDO8991618.1 hypothetical protein [Daejeonella sp.]MDP2413667.1 hypothetical protein [Daejeonella sp.]